MEALYFGIIILVFSVALKLYFTLTAGKCKSKRLMEGKTVIITGANSGIGLETARQLATSKARVILACRDMGKARRAADDIIATTQNRHVVIRHLDLASLDSVHQFSKDIYKTESRLDVLIHNAGVTPSIGRHMTSDNLELQFATNHFGPFLLNHLLLDLLKRSKPSRIVVVSSVTHHWASLDFSNLNCEKYERHPYSIYCSTKLANILFTRELSKRLEGTGVTANALHPGGVRTAIARNAHPFIKYFIIPFLYPFFKTPESGAQTSVYLAVEDKLETVSGKYFADCREAWTSSKARDDKLSRELWTLSEKFTGIKSK